MSEAREYWDRVYRTKSETEVSWYQRRPEQSLRLILTSAPDRQSAIIDVGGGASSLIDLLLAESYRRLTVLDISETALDRSRARLGARGAGVNWIAADVTTWVPDRRYDVWHDRAVFHFLILAATQEAYLATLKRATAPGASVIVATFALDGPDRCSGLPVQRYSPATLGERLGPEFRLVSEVPETHLTPGGKEQRFVYSVFERAG
jgi:ubiquinone/menaquinone biosynthesis C-methylase UbiE